MNESEIRKFANKLQIKEQLVNIPGTSIYATSTLVTPEQASDWIEHHNSRNRPRRIGKVRQHLANMRKGNWKLTHQGIAFDENGEITSAQHRLAALANLDEPLRFVVFLNCPNEEREVVDQTLGRGGRDVAMAHGKDVSAFELAIARTVRYGAAVRAPVQMTPQETFEWYEQHGPAIRSVLKHMDRRVPGVCTAPVLGAIVRASKSLKKSDVKSIVETLVSGMPSTEKDRVLVRLRNWLLEHRDETKNTAGRSKAYLRTQAALQAWIEGLSETKLYEPKEDLFPLVEGAA